MIITRCCKYDRVGSLDVLRSFCDSFGVGLNNDHVRDLGIGHHLLVISQLVVLFTSSVNRLYFTSRTSSDSITICTAEDDDAGADWK